MDAINFRNPFLYYKWQIEQFQNCHWKLQSLWHHDWQRYSPFFMEEEEFIALTDDIISSGRQEIQDWFPKGKKILSRLDVSQRCHLQVQVQFKEKYSLQASGGAQYGQIWPQIDKKIYTQNTPKIQRYRLQKTIQNSGDAPLIFHTKQRTNC